MPIYWGDVGAWSWASLHARIQAWRAERFRRALLPTSRLSAYRQLLNKGVIDYGPPDTPRNSGRVKSERVVSISLDSSSARR